MAKAIKCDLCGRLYAIADGYQVMVIEKYNEKDQLLNAKPFDICEECQDRILQRKGKPSKDVTCATCDVPDLNCREQCKDK